MKLAAARARAVKEARRRFDQEKQLASFHEQLSAAQRVAEAGVAAAGDRMRAMAARLAAAEAELRRAAAAQAELHRTQRRQRVAARAMTCVYLRQLALRRREASAAAAQLRSVSDALAA